MAQHRHKRDTDARSSTPDTTPDPRTPDFRPSGPAPSLTRRAVRIAAPVAVMATVTAVGIGVLAANPESDILASSSASGSIGSVDLSERDTTVSRSASRSMGRRSEKALDRFQARQQAQAERRATQRAIRRADTRRWTTTALDLWTAPGGDARRVGLLDGRERVLVTGRQEGDRTEVVIHGDSRWVTTGYLVAEKPKPEPKPEPETETESQAAPEAALGGACTNGTSVDGQPNVIEVHRAVCAAFPDITSYGTYRGDGEHAQGIAIDIMVSGSYGWEVAEFLRSHYSELGISYIIYSQKIWSVERAGEGWRWMEDRGSTTANHYDHVHVTTY